MIFKKEENPYVKSYLPPSEDGIFIPLKELITVGRRYIRELFVCRPARYVVLDVETTGLSVEDGDRIIEIAAVAVKGGIVVEEFYSLVNPGVRVRRGAWHIHGITTRMLKKQPHPKDVIPHFQKFITGSIIVAHDARFNIGFIKREFHALGLYADALKYICTLELSKKLFPRLQSHKLEAIVQHVLGIPTDEINFHSAQVDTRMLTQVWVALQRELRGSEKHKHLLNPGLA